jgi:hypothetical protein
MSSLNLPRRPLPCQLVPGTGTLTCQGAKWPWSKTSAWLKAARDNDRSSPNYQANLPSNVLHGLLVCWNAKRFAKITGAGWPAKKPCQHVTGMDCCSQALSARYSQHYQEHLTDLSYNSFMCLHGMSEKRYAKFIVLSAIMLRCKEFSALSADCPDKLCTMPGAPKRPLPWQRVTGTESSIATGSPTC